MMDGLREVQFDGRGSVTRGDGLREASVTRGDGLREVQLPEVMGLERFSYQR